MKGRLDWRKASLSSKPKLSVKDEEEFRGRDAASRWLARNPNGAAKKKRRRSA